MKSRFESLEEQTQILEQIATGFPQGSPQEMAVKYAAYALIFSITEHFEAFTQFISSSHAELSDEQKDQLKKLGLWDH